MKTYNLHNRLKPKFKKCLNQKFHKYPGLVDLCRDFLIDNTDVQNLTLKEWSNFLILTSDIQDRHDMDYIQIFYGDLHFMTNEETHKYRESILDSIGTPKEINRILGKEEDWTKRRNYKFKK
jgi:hypothetical protein